MTRYLSGAIAAVALFVPVVFAGCSDDTRAGGLDAGAVDASTGADGGVPDGGSADAGAPDAAPRPFELTSSAFAEGEPIPTRHECGSPVVPGGPGDNVTPPLAWTAGPPETLSYAIVMRDRDAGDLVHWVLYDIPAAVREVPEDVPAGYEPGTPEGAKQAELQMSGYLGYLGPCSEGRTNTYELTLHALDTVALPDVGRTTTENDMAAQVESVSIASTSLSGES